MGSEMCIRDRSCDAPYLVIDGRRMLVDYETLPENGFGYLPVGGRFIAGKTEASAEGQEEKVGAL